MTITRLIIALACLTTALVGYGTFYRVIRAESTHAALLSAQIENKTEAQSRTTAARARLEELSADEAMIGKYFVSTDSVVSFLGDLEARGTSAGASVKVLSVSAGTNAGYPTLQIALQINGTFSAVMNTVGSIEYAPYDISDGALSMNTGGEGWTATMAISVGSAPASPTSPSSP